MDIDYISRCWNHLCVLVQYLKSLDRQVTRNLQQAPVLTRQAESNGLWSCFLLPVILNVYVMQFKVSPLYKLVAAASLGLLFYCLLFILFLSVSGLFLKDVVYGGCLPASIFSILLMYTCLGHDLMFSIYFSVPPVLLCNWLLHKALKDLPKTFTIGEALVFVQGTVLFTIMTIASLTTKLYKYDEEMKLISTIIYTEFATVAIIIGELYFLNEEQRSLRNLCCILVVSLFLALVVLHAVLGPYCLVQVFEYIFIQKNRVAIINFWLLLLCTAVLVVSARTALAVKASTVTRKTLHVLAAAVFLTGILCDASLMLLAAGVAFGVIVLLEALRKSDIIPISPALQSAFLIYRDEKDSGEFSMTAVYLFLGLWCPLVLVPGAVGAGRVLESLSGVLSLGVGDTAASWFGSKYGFKKWPGGNRTYEGTVFNVLSQVATVYALQLFELLDENNAIFRTCFAATITGLVEAKTHQVDNLVLPFVMMLAYQATWFLR